MSNNKIDVVFSIKKLKDIIISNPDIYYCLYLAHKSKEDWDKSTSRIFMNNLFKNYVYLPVDIDRYDYESLKKVYSLSKISNNIIAINHTQPHKSNPVLKEFFDNKYNLSNIDVLIKENNKLIPFDLNGLSFMSWYKDEVGSFSNKTVIIFGVGGAGEPLARSISKEKPNNIILVDPIDKSDLANELSTNINIKYANDLENIDKQNISNLIFINAAGKEGTENKKELENFIKHYRNKNYIFVDLRPHLDIPIVKSAKDFGWSSYTGHGMNARNDYILISKICSVTKIIPPSFEKFLIEVRKAS